MLLACSRSPRLKAAAIRAVFQESGELSLCRRFPGITDNRQARECVRTIASWKPLRAVKRTPKHPRCDGRVSAG
jgi:hypothetical protein